MQIIDIHCHALFGVDDGPQTLEESILMLNDAIANGISDLILTPHQNQQSSTENFQQNFNLLQAAAKHLKINIYLGAEIKYYQTNINDYQTINKKKYLLVEFSTEFEQSIEEICYNLRTSGLKPIVAHIERYHYLKKGDYFKIKEQAKIQVNAETIIGNALFKEDKKIVKYLLKKKLVDYVGSDAHNTTTRKNEMLKAYQTVSKCYGKEYADLIFKENAKELL